MRKFPHYPGYTKQGLRTGSESAPAEDRFEKNGGTACEAFIEMVWSRPPSKIELWMSEHVKSVLKNNPGNRTYLEVVDVREMLICIVKIENRSLRLYKSNRQ